MEYNSYVPLRRPAAAQREPPPPPEPPRRRGRAVLLVAGAAAFVALCAAVATGVVLQRQHRAAAAGASPSAAPVALPPPATGTDAPLVHGPRPKTLLSVEGSGPGRTPRFTTGTDWYLRYSYDCPPNQDGLTVRIFEYSATGAGVEVANETEDTGSDTLPQHTAAGSRYLRITTQCTWTITILG